MQFTTRKSFIGLCLYQIFVLFIDLPLHFTNRELIIDKIQQREFIVRFAKFKLKMTHQYKHRYFCRNEKENPFIGGDTYQTWYCCA